jgi:hypothetical protein
MHAGALRGSAEKILAQRIEEDKKLYEEETTTNDPR